MAVDVETIRPAAAAARAAGAPPAGAVAAPGPEQLDAVLDEAGDAALLDRAVWDRSGAGGAQLALLPPGVDEGRVVADFVRELGAALRRRNGQLTGPARLRLRLAVHQGITRVTEAGCAGPAVVRTRRLLGSAALRARLARNRNADLAVIVSAELFEDVVDQDYPDLRGSDFEPVTLDTQEAGLTARAWVYVPDDADGTPRRRVPRPVGGIGLGDIHGVLRLPGEGSRGG
jgi:hypothetical protein